MNNMVADSEGIIYTFLEDEQANTLFIIRKPMLKNEKAENDNEKEIWIADDGAGSFLLDV